MRGDGGRPVIVGAVNSQPGGAQTTRADRIPVRVWDLPTRVFHWVLAACVIGSVATAKVGGNAMAWHLRLGYVVFTLLAFRFAWGWMGGHWSRFRHFIYGPSTVLRYLRGQSRSDEYLDVGHSPLGALSVFALLALLAMQVATGLFADDEISTTGPLIKFVSAATSALFTTWHTTFGQWLVITLVVVHVAVVVFYLLEKKRNLVRPMIVGDKHLPAWVPPSADHWRVRAAAIVLLAACAAAVAWLVSLGG
jgi:cytochrome b